MAKQVGANAVKFQLFDAMSLYGYLPQGAWESDLEYIMRLQNTWGPNPQGRIKGEMPLDWLPKLADKAKAAGIDFLCTAFSPEGVKAVDPFVPYHKIASSDLTCPQMLEAVKATGKPVILSCGASSKGDIELAVNGHPKLGWKGFGDHPLVLLYCNSAYPSTRHNLFLIEELRKFGKPVGLSDHSLDVIYAPLSAVRHFGAVVIEKHFKLRDDMTTPDSGHSLNPDAFKCMVDYIRGTRDSGLNPTSEERDMFLRHNRRLIATKDIAPGELMQFGHNFGCYRSLTEDSQGTSGFAWEGVQGKVAKVAIQAGAGVSLTMVE
jgi:sialic acid synthase SpsE